MEKRAALFLVLGVVLMVVTMVLHPTGGSFEKLLTTANIGIVAHSLAIFSVPFSGLGFLGLTNYLKNDPYFSKMALAVMFVGLLAATLAATVNGLALPLLVKKYATASPETIDSLSPIFRYNMVLNHSFDYILIAAIFLATLFWSISILRTKKLPQWLGYLGLILVTSLLVALLLGFYFLDLYGFRIFIFGWVLWILMTAYSLFRKSEPKPI